MAVNSYMPHVVESNELEWLLDGEKIMTPVEDNALRQSVEAKAELLLLASTDMHKLLLLVKQCVALEQFASAPPCSFEDMDAGREQLLRLDANRLRLAARTRLLSVRVNELLARYYKMVNISLLFYLIFFKLTDLAIIHVHVCRLT